jgi:hypothetical protein
METLLNSRDCVVIGLNCLVIASFWIKKALIAKKGETAEDYQESAGWSIGGIWPSATFGCQLPLLVAEGFLYL